MGFRYRIQPCHFFRSKLLRLTTPEQVQKYVKSLEREQAELISATHEIMWHMRGSVTRQEAWTLSPGERRAMMEDVKRRMKLVEKTGLPLL